MDRILDLLGNRYQLYKSCRRSGEADEKETYDRKSAFLTLKYLRQYVTQKELAFEFEVGEATVCDTIKRVEDVLIRDGDFSLPGKKVLLEDDSIEVVLVDVTECPIERPQKNKENGIPAKRNDTQLNTSNR